MANAVNACLAISDIIASGPVRIGEGYHGNGVRRPHEEGSAPVKNSLIMLNTNLQKKKTALCVIKMTGYQQCHSSLRILSGVLVLTAILKRATPFQSRIIFARRHEARSVRSSAKQLDFRPNDDDKSQPRKTLPWRLLAWLPTDKLVWPSVPLDTAEFPPVLRDFAANIISVAGEWILTYPSLDPETPWSPAGNFFLATNIGFISAGTNLLNDGDTVLGALSIASAIVSWWYHYEQLASTTVKGGNKKRTEVAILVDYIVAVSCIAVGCYYVFELGLDDFPFTAASSASLALLCLFIGWFPPIAAPLFRTPWAGTTASYIAAHSMWHVLSAYTLYDVGEAHLACTHCTDLVPSLLELWSGSPVN
jgi:hypothetical protein